MQDAGITLATCWKLVSPANVIVGATSHTRDLILSGHPGVTFLSSQGVVPSAVDNEAGLGSAGLEVDAMFAVNVIDEESIVSGSWDESYFEVFVLNYMAPQMGELIMFAGTIGEIRTYGQRFRAEGRPLTSKAGLDVGLLYTPKCTVVALGDARCKLNLAANAPGDGGVITVTGTVTGSATNQQFFDSAQSQPSSYFDYGILTFTSGVLNGKQSEIRSFSGTGTSNSTRTRIVTDNTWRWNSTNPAGWNTTAGFNDSAWTLATSMGTNGVYPWGTVNNFPSDSTAQWIWSRNSVDTNVPETRYFRKVFTPNVSSGTLRVTCDDDCTVYVNGTSLGTSGNNWHVPQTFAISGLTVGVPNLIAIQATNASITATPTGNPAGLLVDVELAPYIQTVGGGGTFQLQTAMTRIIPIGTTYTAIRGCDRTFQTCKNVYGNLLNFRGFPFVPGIEKAYKVNQNM
jgi:uncharacterized phage protein (TIGR02218 family)